MTKLRFRIASAVGGGFVSFCAVGCGGGHGYYDGGGGGVPHTSSSYSYTGSIGSTGQLIQPDAIALDTSGNIFVASYAQSGIPKITKFDPSGNYLLDFGNTGTLGAGLLRGPQGVYVDGSGNSYVADAKSGQIVVFNSSNQFTANLLTGQVGTFPYQIKADSSGNLYVAASDLGEVIKFSPAGAVLAVFGKTGAGILRDPDGVAIDGSGNVYVSDYAYGAIFEYSSSGAFLKQFGNTGTYRLNGPQGIAYSPTQGIFVADIKNGYVYHYDTNGNFIETIGNYSGAGSLYSPYDVTISSTGALLVVDSGNNRVAEFTTQFNPLSKSAKP